MMVFDRFKRCVRNGSPALILFLYTFSRNIEARVGLTELKSFYFFSSVNFWTEATEK